MRLGAMQPYFFPYLGYFQLIARSDVFVFLDDVQYISRGWSNRNRILTNGSASWIRLPVKYANRNATFNQREFVLDDKVRDQFLKHLYHSYHNAPHFKDVYSLAEDILAQTGSNVAKFNITLITDILSFVGLERRIERASCIDPEPKQRGQWRIIDLCRAAESDTYINPMHGAYLYDQKAFEAAGLALRFMSPELRPYPQRSKVFVPGLSIIDPLMWCGAEEVRQMLKHGRVSAC